MTAPTYYLTTTIINECGDTPLVEHATPDGLAEARTMAAQNVKWYGINQGFKVHCRIHRDDGFEEIVDYPFVEAVLR